MLFVHVIWKTTASIFQLFYKSAAKYSNTIFYFWISCLTLTRFPFSSQKCPFSSLRVWLFISLSLAHGSWLCAVRLICPVWLCMLNAVLNCPAPSAHTPSYTHNSHPSRPRANTPPQTSSHTPKTNPALSTVLLSPAAHLKERVFYSTLMLWLPFWENFISDV